MFPIVAAVVLAFCAAANSWAYADSGNPLNLGAAVFVGLLSVIAALCYRPRKGAS